MKTALSERPTRHFRDFIRSGHSGIRRVLIWGLLSTLFLGMLFALKPTLLQSIDFINYDFLLRHFPNNHAGAKLIIVDIDEKSLNRYGQWPWPRYRIAELFDKIATLKPAVIGLDMFFAEPDRTSAGRLLKDLGDAYKLNITLNRIPDKLSDNDQILAESLARGPFVLGNKFHFNRIEKSSEQCILHPCKVALKQSTGPQSETTGLPESTGVLCNLKILSQAADASGFVNFSPDRDGMLRRLPMLIQYDGNVYAGLGLAVVLKYRGMDNLILQKDGDDLYAINFKGASVPVDRTGRLLIKFRGPKKSFDYVSAVDIMDGKVSSQRMEGRIALVGTSAAGLHDVLTTPFDPIYPGVEVHATIIDNLLNGDFISEPDWSEGMVLMLILVLGASLSLFIVFRGAAAGFLVMLLFIAGVWLATQQAFYRMGIFVGTAFPMAAVVCQYIFLTVLKHRLEEKRMLSGMKELLVTQDITIESMANLTEYRDKETGGHIKRTRMYVKLLAEHIKAHEKYNHFLTNENIDMLYKSAPLHDIGKVAIPDRILLKPGRLTDEEFEVMKTHTTIGHNVIESSVRKLGKNSFLTIAAEIALSHQEKWDGSGFPQGLKGDAIPISGRLMALADVYDALTSKRIYKPPLSHAVSVEIIRKGRGTHFDPDMVDAFLEIHERFRDIAGEFADFQEERETLAKDTPAGDLMHDSEKLSARE